MEQTWPEARGGGVPSRGGCGQGVGLAVEGRHSKGGQGSRGAPEACGRQRWRKPSPRPFAGPQLYVETRNQQRQRQSTAAMATTITTVSTNGSATGITAAVAGIAGAPNTPPASATTSAPQQAAETQLVAVAAMAPAEGAVAQSESTSRRQKFREDHHVINGRICSCWLRSTFVEAHAAPANLPLLLSLQAKPCCYSADPR